MRERTLLSAHERSVTANQEHLSSLLAEREKISALLVLKRENAAAKAAQSARYSQLVAKGFGSGVEEQRRQSELLGAKQDVLEGEMRRATLERDIEDLRKQVAEEQATFDLALNELRQQRTT